MKHIFDAQGMGRRGRTGSSTRRKEGRKEGRGGGGRKGWQWRAQRREGMEGKQTEGKKDAAVS